MVMVSGFILWKDFGGRVNGASGRPLRYYLESLHYIPWTNCFKYILRTAEQGPANSIYIAYIWCIVGVRIHT